MKDNMSNQQIEALLAVRRFVERNTVSADNGYAAGVDAANRNVITHIDWLLEQVRAGQNIPFGVEVGRVWPFESRAVPAPQPVAVDRQLIYALERAARQMRAIASRLGTPDDPYGGLMHADDADLLEDLLAVLDPASVLPVVERVAGQQPASTAARLTDPLQRSAYVEGWYAALDAHGIGKPAPQPLTDEVRELLGSMVSELRKHRWCGDCYPENGWPSVMKVLADYAAFKRSRGIGKDQT